jgi:hypothetical protein
MVKDIKTINWLRKGFFLSAILFLTLPFGCKEDGAVVPEFNSSNLNFGDTIIHVKSATVAGDSVLTSNTSRNLLGKINDMTYGLSEADFYSQIQLSGSSLNIPDEVNFDSIVLYLAYDNFYGFPYEQEVRIYELADAFESDKEYYSNNALVTSDLLGSSVLKIAESDTFGDSTYVLRIKLDQSLATRIKEKAVFSNQDAWLEFFKGIKVTTDETVIPTDAGDGGGAVVYFNLLSKMTKMSLYYQGTGGTESEELIVKSESMRFSNFKNTYSDSLNAVLENEALPYNFIGAMAGTRTRISLQNISDWAAKAPIVINKARLIIPYEESNTATNAPPDRNVIIMKDDAGAWVLPPDFLKGGSEFFGGKIDKVNLEYSFNLASTLHDMINNANFDKDLYLSVSGSAVTANRLKLNSGTRSKREIILILSYTKTR